MEFNFNNAVNDTLKEMDKKASYPTDDRFYTLKKDENKCGAALIRFLPSELFEDGSMSTIKKVYKYNVRSKTGKGFLSAWSPSTIGKEDPIQKKWALLWNSGKKEESKRYARSTRYLANIKVINDPKAPENNGKIFLLDMSQSLMDRIRSIMAPSDADIALGKKPKNLFNPIEGYNFMLIAKPGANDMITYLDSDAAGDVTSIYESVEAATKDISENCYKLSDWDKPEAYPTYEYLEAELAKVDGEAVAETQAQTTQTVQAFTDQVVEATQPAQPAQTVPAQGSATQDLDALINSLGK